MKASNTDEVIMTWKNNQVKTDVEYLQTLRKV
jgi:hypothetical protein